MYAGVPKTLPDWVSERATFIASWTLSAPFPTDRVILDLDSDGNSAVTDVSGNGLIGNWNESVSAFPTSGSSGTDFRYRFIVAVGDADRNGLVRNADVNLARANLFVDAGSPGYNIYADIDGNGLLRNADLNAVRARLFTDPPAGPGPNRPGSNRQGDRNRRTPRVVERAFDSKSTGDATDRKATVARRSSVVRSVAALDALFAEV